LRFGLWILSFVVVLLAPPARAQDREPTTFWHHIKERGIYERIWEKLTLYENEENAALQAFSIVGRYHGQYWAVTAGNESPDGWENRRIYVGAEAQLYRQLVVHGQIAISQDFSPFYDGLYQAFLEWSPRETFSLSVGRLDFLFAGLERSISSNRIVTFERGQLVNHFHIEQVSSVAASSRSSRVSRAALARSQVWVTTCLCFTNRAAFTWITSSTMALLQTTRSNLTTTCYHSGIKGKKARSAWALT
jgi:hypothetical protein